MIIGVILRGYKAFNKTTYIPLTDSAEFTALIGDNGVGKSSVLESLDSFFNAGRFNRNKDQQQRGQKRLEDVAFVAPVFVLNQNDIKNLSADEKKLAESISTYFKNIPDNNKILIEVKNHINKLELNQDSYVLSFCRYSHDREFENALINVSLHNHIYKNSEEFGLNESDFGNNLPGEKSHVKTFKALASLKSKVIDHYSYVYIPVEANETDFTKLESKTVEKLSSNDLFKDIADLIKAPKVAKEINKLLDEYLVEIEQNLPNLKYDSSYRRKFTHTLLVEKIVEGYFSTKTLHRTTPKVPISDLSAGEKRQALLAFCTTLLEKASEKGSLHKKVVFALDEPESSLHVSRIYGQIERLRGIATNCSQVLITTHWYGFIPVLDKGWVQSLTIENDEIIAESFDLENFYHETRVIKKGSNGSRPFDTNLKGYSELVQTILNSIMNEDPYKWIICEGITDAMYLKAFLSSGKYKNTKIIPVAGMKNVIKLYKLLYPIISDSKDQVKAPVLCLIDTDDELPNTKEILPGINNKLNFVRFCNDASKQYQTSLVNEKSLLTGKTIIEDVLPPNTFFETLKEFEDDISFKLNDRRNNEGTNSYNILDLKTSERTELLNFFNKNDGANKEKFAKVFCDKLLKSKEIPAWLKELEGYLN